MNGIAPTLLITSVAVSLVAWLLPKADYRLTSIAAILAIQAIAAALMWGPK
jgi:hypothetical protein